MKYLVLCEGSNELYFGKNPEKIVRVIREYRSLRKKHNNGQGYLNDLLK